jgi:hypothetical protein
MKLFQLSDHTKVLFLLFISGPNGAHFTRHFLDPHIKRSVTCFVICIHWVSGERCRHGVEMHRQTGLIYFSSFCIFSVVFLFSFFSLKIKSFFFIPTMQPST